MTFYSQVSLKSHDVCNLEATLHVIDNNELLSIVNAIGEESKI